MKRLSPAAAALLGIASAASVAGSAPAQITLDPVVAGPTATVAGSGTTAHGPVELWINGRSAGSTRADAQGSFAFERLQIAAGDVLWATASQAWNFDRDGQFEGWSAHGASATVSGGVLRATAQLDNIVLDLASADPHAVFDTNLTRVLEIRYRIIGPFAEANQGMVLHDPGTGMQNAQPWRIDPLSPGFATVVIDMTDGGANGWASTGTASRLAFGTAGFQPGSILEIDTIRLSESFDWDFRHDGDLMGNRPVGATASATGGALVLANTTAGVRARIGRSPSRIDAGHFTVLEALLGGPPPAGQAVVEIDYLAGPSASDPGRIAVAWQPGSGAPALVVMDLSTASPASGSPWSGTTSLGRSEGWFSPSEPFWAGEATEIQSLRLRPAVVLGPSAPVQAMGSASAAEWPGAAY